MPSRKKTHKSIQHEYISTKQYKHGWLFRLSNYFVLLSMIVLERVLDIKFSETIYLLVFSAIVGYDVPAIINFIKGFVSKKK